MCTLSLVTTRNSDLPRPSATVNERLQQLRLSNPSAELAQRQRDIALESIQHSVPPELGSILGVREIAAPPPKPGGRNRTRLRTPGPAPPPSWLNPSGQRDATASKTMESGSGETYKTHNRPRSRWLLDFARRTGHFSISHHSLVHLALKTIARAWNGNEEDEFAVLASIPEHLRSPCIAYIAYYGSLRSRLTRHHLEVLFGTGDGFSCLDLAALIGWSVSLSELADVILQRRGTRRRELGGGGQALQADSWDDHTQTGIGSSSLSRSLSPSIPLTALSLGDPPTTISWTDLLHLTKHLPTLTNLSLRAWPWPSNKPNPAGTTYTPPILDGYEPSITSDDGRRLEEARSILRKLSGHTYCLRTLDASCCSWFEALAPTQQLAPSQSSDDWPTAEVSSGPDWRGAWKLVSNVTLGHATSLDGPRLNPDYDTFDTATLFEDYWWQADHPTDQVHATDVEEKVPGRKIRCTRDFTAGEVRDHCALTAPDRDLRHRLILEKQVRRVGQRVIQAKRDAGAGPVHISYGKEEAPGW